MSRRPEYPYVKKGDAWRRVVGWAEGLTRYPHLDPTGVAHLIIAVPCSDGTFVGRPACDNRRVIVSHHVGKAEPGDGDRCRPCTRCQKVAREELRILTRKEADDPQT